jgi:hypothetical protein
MNVNAMTSEKDNQNPVSSADPNEMIDWSIIISRLVQEFFTFIETSSLQVKGCKIKAYAWRSGPYRATPTVTLDLCFSGLIRRTAHSVASYDTHGDAEDLF